MTRPRGGVLLVIALLAFASLGLPDGVLGVAWPSIRRSFDLPLSALGALLVAAMVGYLVSSFGSGWIVARFGVGRLLVWSSLLMAANSAGYALAPSWRGMVALGLLAGLGAGAIDAGINAFAASRFPPRLVNWLHACYGIGATLGPLLMTAVLTRGLSWRVGYGMIGGLLAAMAAAFYLTRRRWKAVPTPAGNERPAEAVPSAGLVETLRRPLVWLSLALFFVYTGIEVIAGQWTYSLFVEGRGETAAAAGAWVSGYWASLTLGRLVGGALAGRWSSLALLRIGTLGAPLAALAIWLGPGSRLDHAGLLLLGAALAPIFPLLIAGTSDRLGARFAAHAIGFQVAAAYLGAAMLPAAAGWVARSHGLELIGPALLAASLVLLALHETALRRPPRGMRARRRGAAPACA